MSTIKMECCVETVRYYRDNWGIILVSPIKVTHGDVKVNYRGYATLKGVLPEKPCVGDHYNINAEYSPDPSWGDQYELISIFPSVVYDKTDEDSKKKFLKILFTEKQIENMYEALDDPFTALDERDYYKLVQVYGCGTKTAVLWADRFHSKKSLIKIFTELDKYNLTNNMVNRLIDRYTYPEIVIKKVKENPYILCTEVQGIGWAKADAIALAGGIDPYGVTRVCAFIVYYLLKRGDEGCSWVTTDELIGAIDEQLGSEVPDDVILLAVNSELTNKLWIDKERQLIGLKSYYNIEQRIAEELIRIRDAESRIHYSSNWEDVLLHLEHKQGWKYTEEQKRGIQTALNNNVVVVAGLAGTGKSSLVSALIEILKGYSNVQCALSGRAASRLSEITGKEGFTIHRLLGFPTGDESKGKFFYHDENQLQYDIYILDEISMVDGRLFYSLLRAIPNGAKIICLGDPGQLESIGMGNIAYDMIRSEEIPTVILTTIHRQAQKSAIITESIKIRHGEMIVEKDWVGHDVRGELQDLELDCYSDISNTYYRVMRTFAVEQAKDNFNIMNLQVLSPRKSTSVVGTYNLNNAIQNVYNPPDTSKKEEQMHSKNGDYILREGDKVINTVNNYNVRPAIYNGNIGMLKKIRYDNELEEDVMEIDFVGVGLVVIPKKFWNGIELGYAVTVHKYQGSQARTVILAIDFSSYALLTRELIYTGITRAENKCILIAQTGALRMAISQEGTSKKQTHLRQCLYDVAHPKLIF